MARAVGSSLRGPAIASLRGGSNPLAGKSVVLATISKEGAVSSSIQAFNNPRGESFSNFLRSVKGGDGGAAPLFPLRPLTASQADTLKRSDNAAAVVEKSLSPATVSKSKPSVVWFGPPIGNVIPEQGDFVQPDVVVETVKFNQIQVTEVSKSSLSSSVEQSAVNLVKSEDNSVKAEPLKDKLGENLSTVKVNLLQSVLSPVEKAYIDMRVKQARVALLRSKVQAIPMAGVEPEVAVVSQVLTTSVPETAQEKTDAKSKDETDDVRKTALTTVRPVRKLVRADSDETLRRKRFAEKDLKMNALRLKALVKGYDDLKSEDPLNEVNGDALARKSFIGTSREFRSVFLDQRGYRDREDGTQRRMELLLEAVKGVDKAQLKEIVNKNTAIKETLDHPVENASFEEVWNVVNRPDRLDGRVEPEVIEEVVESRKTERIAPVKTKDFGEASVEPQKNEGEAAFSLEQSNFAATLSRSLDLGHNISSIFQPHVIYREGVVFN